MFPTSLFFAIFYCIFKIGIGITSSESTKTESMDLLHLPMSSAELDDNSTMSKLDMELVFGIFCVTENLNLFG